MAKTHLSLDFVYHGFLASYPPLDHGLGWYSGCIGDKSSKLGPKGGLLVNQGSPLYNSICESLQTTDLLSPRYSARRADLKNGVICWVSTF